jgi:hypothetical protein
VGGEEAFRRTARASALAAPAAQLRRAKWAEAGGDNTSKLRIFELSKKPTTDRNAEIIDPEGRA